MSSLVTPSTIGGGGSSGEELTVWLPYKNMWVNNTTRSYSANVKAGDFLDIGNYWYNVTISFSGNSNPEMIPIFPPVTANDDKQRSNIIKTFNNDFPALAVGYYFLEDGTINFSIESSESAYMQCQLIRRYSISQAKNLLSATSSNNSAPNFTANKRYFISVAVYNSTTGFGVIPSGLSEGYVYNSYRNSVVYSYDTYNSYYSLIGFVLNIGDKIMRYGDHDVKYRCIAPDDYMDFDA